MKRYILLFSITLSASFIGNAQTKIKDGTITSTSAPKVGAILDLESDDKALLLPRISLINTEVWGLAGDAPTEGGYEVYNTNASIVGTAIHPALTGGIGLYYWDGVAWIAKNLIVEPWNILGTPNQANMNNESIYQSGRVLVAFPSAYTSGLAGTPYNATSNPTSGSVIGQNFNVMNNFGVSRLASAGNMVIFRAEGTTWDAPANTATPGTILGNLLFEGYSNGKRLASSTPGNYGNGRVGVAQIRAISRNTFADNENSWGELHFMTQGLGYGLSQQMITRMTLSPLGNVGIGTAPLYQNPLNRLVVEGPVDLTTGSSLSSVDRSGVRLDNVKSASFLGTDANGDIIRVAAPSGGSTTVLEPGINTTLDGTGAPTNPYKVNVATSNGTLATPTLGVVKQATTNPTVLVTADGTLSLLPRTVRNSTDLTLLTTDDIVTFVGVAGGSYNFPTGMPIGKTFSVVNAGPSIHTIRVADCFNGTTDVLNSVNPGTTRQLIHVGSDKWVVMGSEF